MESWCYRLGKDCLSPSSSLSSALGSTSYLLPGVKCWVSPEVVTKGDARQPLRTSFTQGRFAQRPKDKEEDLFSEWQVNNG
ncbi:hypothetical protein NPIL_71041 [Nephila pilipes]|uniref:Uncharacterized protein n=1 Tax=Nephila pilipes TaxID=299642 RepID=A0A8X6MUJ5_NEPPI|nr:hypothetical protein NPIL_71041 [Nephila pilipes]